MKTDSGKDRLGKAKDRLDAKITEMVSEITDGPNHPKDTNVEEQQAQGEMPAASADMEDADEAMSGFCSRDSRNNRDIRWNPRQAPH